MFAAALDALLLSLKSPDRLLLVPSVRDRARWDAVDSRLSSFLSLRAERASKERAPQLYFGDLAELYQDGHATYRRDRGIRRELLKALLLGHALRGGAYTARIADLIWDACGERSWTDPQTDRMGGYQLNGLLDESVVEMAELLAVFCHIATDDRLSPVIARAQKKVRETVLHPLIDGENWPFLRDLDTASAGILGLLIASLLTPADDHERWLCVRKCVLLLDDLLDAMAKDALHGGLEKTVCRVADVARCLDLIDQASGGEVDLRSDQRFLDAAQLFCALHIGAGWFVNPGGDTMQPEINIPSLYAVARVARDSRLLSLASFLNRRAAIAQPPFDENSGPLYPQLRAALDSAQLSAAPAKTEQLSSVRIDSLRIIARRQDAFYAALLGGGQNASGEFILFYGNEPVLIDAGLNAAKGHTVPLFGGISQRKYPGAEDIEQDDGLYSLLSMNVAGAYPDAAKLGSYQRSVMFMPFDESVRLMDVYEFDRARQMTDFVFITPHEPRIGDGEATLGPVRMIWESGLTARVERLTPTNERVRSIFPYVYRLTLSTVESALGGNYTFIFRDNKNREAER